MYTNNNHKMIVGRQTPFSVCHTYCTQTYVLAAKKSQCTGMKKKQIISDVRAMQIKKTEKAKP
jgi:hypothetical protein